MRGMRLGLKMRERLENDHNMMVNRETLKVSALHCELVMSARPLVE